MNPILSFFNFFFTLPFLINKNSSSQKKKLKKNIYKSDSFERTFIKGAGPHICVTSKSVGHRSSSKRISVDYHPF